MRELLDAAIQELTAAGCETPRLDAEVLLAHALGCERHQLYSRNRCDIWYQVPYVTFQSHIKRRAKREPVAYITGVKEFWSIPIKVTPDVLIPRPETEAVVERALPRLMTHDPALMTILDLCTGSGCIAAAIAKELPQAQFVVSDISDAALAVAKENLAFAKGRVTFVPSDLFQNIDGRFDLIISNPPYVASADWENLQPEIKNYEPRLALDGGPSGLDFIGRIRHSAPRYLKPDGWLVLENGPEIQKWKNSSLKEANRFTEPLPSAAPKIPLSP